MLENGAHARPLNQRQTGENYPRKRYTKALKDQSKPDTWLEYPCGKRAVEEAGLGVLKSFLQEPFKVEPRFTRSQSDDNWPVLDVCPADLFEHILSFLPKVYGERRNWVKPVVEVYGGVARSVVAADEGLTVSAPTDFDARFYIRHMQDGREFEKCRCVVEQFLLEKLRQSAPQGSSFSRADLSVVRNNYFQKQVVLGGFSLLSIGDSHGKVIDLEFTLNTDRTRKYFDDTSSFVVPLSSSQINAIHSTVENCDPVRAFTMTKSFDNALKVLRNNQLVIRQPKVVVNGLALYAHALSFKKLTPLNESKELEYSRAIGSSFARNSAEMLLRGEDPLRYVKSFVRSHYADCPVGAYAMAAQMLVELAHGTPLEQLDAFTLSRIGDVYAYLGELVGELAVSATGAALDDAVLLECVNVVTRFLSNGRGYGGLDNRRVEVAMSNGRVVHLLRKRGSFCGNGERSFDQAASHLRRAAAAANSDAAREQLERMALALESAVLADAAEEMLVAGSSVQDQAAVSEQPLHATADACDVYSSSAIDAVPAGGGGVLPSPGGDPGEGDWADCGASGPAGPVSVGPQGEAECLAWLDDWFRPAPALSEPSSPLPLPQRAVAAAPPVQLAAPTLPEAAASEAPAAPLPPVEEGGGAWGTDDEEPSRPETIGPQDAAEDGEAAEGGAAEAEGSAAPPETAGPLDAAECADGDGGGAGREMPGPHDSEPHGSRFRLRGGAAARRPAADCPRQAPPGAEERTVDGACDDEGCGSGVAAGPSDPYECETER